MINRLLIRIKTVQLVYACLQSETPRIFADEKLRESLESTQKLYNYLLALIVKVTDYRRQQILAAKGKFLPTREDLNPNTRFVDNRLARMIAEKSEAVDFCEREGLTSDFDTELYRTILEAIEQSETFGQYMTQREAPTFEQDKELWLEILTTIFPQCEKLDEVLEERDIYWNDDLTTVLKALTRMIQRLRPEREMIPAGKLFQHEEDERFALDLFHYSLDEYYDNVKLIDAITPNWEAERIAMMDKVIIACALSEIRHFDDIAIAVSVNEYIELAKHYCSAKSASFANGVIDKIATSWRADHVIIKK